MTLLVTLLLSENSLMISFSNQLSDFIKSGTFSKAEYALDYHHVSLPEF